MNNKRNVDVFEDPNRVETIRLYHHQVRRPSVAVAVLILDKLKYALFWDDSRYSDDKFWKKKEKKKKRFAFLFPTHAYWMSIVKYSGFESALQVGETCWRHLVAVCKTSFANQARLHSW